jgi:hypothetical protein
MINKCHYKHRDVLLRALWDVDFKENLKQLWLQQFRDESAKRLKEQEEDERRREEQRLERAQAAAARKTREDAEEAAAEAARKAKKAADKEAAREKARKELAEVPDGTPHPLDEMRDAEEFLEK